MPFQNHDLPELQNARALLAKGNFRDSIPLFKKILRKNSRNLLALFDTARACGHFYQILEAEKILQPIRREARRGGGDIFLMRELARTDAMIHRLDRSLEGYLEVAAHSDAGEQDFVEAATLAERLGNCEQASQLLDRIPQSMEGQALRAKLALRAQDPAKAEVITKNLIGEVQEREDLVSLHYLLGKTLDVQGQFDGAWAAVLEAKKLQEPDYQRVRIEDLSEHDHLVQLFETLEAGDLVPTRSSSHEKEILLLSGCPRSGTSVIERHLSREQGVYTMDEEQIFRDCAVPELFHSIDPASKGRAVWSYLSSACDRSAERVYMRAARENSPTLYDQNSVIVDKNPGIGLQIPVFLKIHPSARVVWVDRDDQDTALSCFMTELPLNRITAQFEDYQSALSWVQKEKELGQMLQAIIGHERLKVIEYQRFIKNPQEVVEDVLGRPSCLAQHEVSHSNSPTYGEAGGKIYARAINRSENYKTQIS